MLITSIFAGCAESHHPTWVGKWIETPVCIPPCWESITPGSTNIMDAYTILATIPEITELKGPMKVSPESEQLVITWSFDECTGGGGVKSDDQGIVSETNFVEFEQTLKLHEIVNKYGEPSEVYQDHCRNSICAVDIIYKDQGMLISTLRPKIFGKLFRITPNTSPSRISFFPPGEEGLQRIMGEGFEEFGNRYSWDGYAYYSTR